KWAHSRIRRRRDALRPPGFSYMKEGLRFGDRHAVQGIALLHRVDDVLAREHLSEDRMLPVQPVRNYVGDEELAPVSVWSGVSHGKRPDLVLMGISLSFVLEAVAGAAAAAAFRVAAL